MFVQAPGDMPMSVYISSQEQENLVLPEGTSALQLLLRAVYHHQLLRCPIIAKEKVFDGPGPPEMGSWSQLLLGSSFLALGYLCLHFKKH